jgi:hypothetical protein
MLPGLYFVLAKLHPTVQIATAGNIEHFELISKLE